MKANDFKKYLLRQLIIKINYNGLVDADIDEFIPKIREYFINNDYALEIGEESNFNIEIPPPQQLLNNEEIKNTLHSVKAYAFTKRNDKISVSSDAVTLVIDTTKEYLGSQYYLNLFKRVYSKLFETYNFIKVTRVGLRKTNMLFFREFEAISKCISDNLYYSSSVVTSIQPSYKNNLSYNYSLYKDDAKNISINTNVDTGKATINNETFDVYRFILDMDSYNDEIQKADSVAVEEWLINFNATLSEIYYHSLTERFREYLCKYDVASDYNKIIIEDWIGEKNE